MSPIQTIFIMNISPNLTPEMIGYEFYELGIAKTSRILSCKNYILEQESICAIIYIYEWMDTDYAFDVIENLKKYGSSTIHVTEEEQWRVFKNVAKYTFICNFGFRSETIFGDEDFSEYYENFLEHDTKPNYTAEVISITDSLDDNLDEVSTVLDPTSEDEFELERTITIERIAT